MKHLSSRIVFVLCLAATPAFAQDPVRPAKVETVQSVTSQASWTFPAIVLPSQEVSVSFRVSGQVIELPVRAATQVKAGDVIARLDPRDFEAQIAQLQSQRDQADAQLAALRAGSRDEEIRALEAGVESARAQADLARSAVERARSLVERNAAAPVTLEQAEGELRVAEATVISQQEQLTMAAAGGRDEDIAASEAAIRGLDAQIQAARDSLNDATLRAPFDGIIARRSIENFSLIQSGQEVVLLQNVSRLHLAFDVPGADVPPLARAAEPRAKVVFAGSDAEYPAELVEFSTQAEAASQTYRGRVGIDAPENGFVLPGMVGEVIVEVDAVTDPATHVSLSALGADPDGTPFVWVVGESGQVAKRPVETGDVTGATVEILSGLEAGETVIAAGVSRIEDAMTVRPVTQVGG